MVAIAVAAGALMIVILMTRFVARWMSRPVNHSGQLGTVSRQWLAVHRAEDK
jgi:hypothetical protein